jgi:hypothetical protein
LLCLSNGTLRFFSDLFHRLWSPLWPVTQVATDKALDTMKGSTEIINIKHRRTKAPLPDMAQLLSLPVPALGNVMGHLGKNRTDETLHDRENNKLQKNGKCPFIEPLTSPRSLRGEAGKEVEVEWLVLSQFQFPLAFVEGG